jgi:hypothetical protein
MRKRLERLSQPADAVGSNVPGKYAQDVGRVLRELGTAPEDMVCEPGAATTQQDGWSKED